MKRGTLFFITILFLFGCETKLPDKKSPESAFSRLAQCVDTASTKCLFWELDTENRWSVSTVHKILKEMYRIVEKSYPADQSVRDEVFGNWNAAANAQSAQEMFRILCEQRQCLSSIAKGFGAIKEMKQTNTTAQIVTVRNQTFYLKKTKDKWGIVLFAEELDREKVRLANSLKQVKRNAAEYEQQRLATGE